jgi:hypothetical protein
VTLQSWFEIGCGSNDYSGVGPPPRFTHPQKSALPIWPPLSAISSPGPSAPYARNRAAPGIVGASAQALDYLSALVPRLQALREPRQRPQAALRPSGRLRPVYEQVRPDPMATWQDD